MRAIFLHLLPSLFATLALALSPAIPAGAAQAAGPTFGQHGMALFGGKDGIFASHLPMFHPPHDYQVVLQIRLQDQALDAQLRKRLGGDTVLWTLAPEKFEIDRLAPGAPRPLTRFQGDLVLGHFEQGGKTEYANAAIVVEKVLLYRQLPPQPSASASARYLQAGSGIRRFLVKEVDSRPDFDHIVAVAAPPRAPLGRIEVPKEALARTPDAVLQRALPGARVTGTVYYDTADLK